MTILDFYRDFHEPKKKTASEWCGPCPACGGEDRFTIFAGQGEDGRGRYWCRQCERGGDAIQFLRDFKGMSFKEACQELGRELPPMRGGHGMANPAGSAGSRDRQDFKPRKNPEPSGPWQDKAARLVEWAARQLAHNSTALAWLEEARGITPATARAAKLGWIPKNLYRDRAAWGLPLIRREDGKPKKLWIPHGLVIPVTSPAGIVRRVKIRLAEPGPNMPRYLPLSQPEDTKNTAPLVVARGAKTWAVVESELDAILLGQEAGDLVNVASLGSASYRPDAELYPLLAAAPFVLVCLDFDPAGGKAAWSWWSRHLPETRRRVWPVPEGKDPSEAWALGWDLRAWIMGGLPPSLVPAPPGQDRVESPAPTDPPPAEPEPLQEQASPEDLTPEQALDLLRAKLPAHAGELVWSVDQDGQGKAAVNFRNGLEDIDVFSDVYALLAKAGPLLDRMKDQLPHRSRR